MEQNLSFWRKFCWEKISDTSKTQNFNSTIMKMLILLWEKSRRKCLLLHIHKIVRNKTKHNIFFIKLFFFFYFIVFEKEKLPQILGFFYQLIQTFSYGWGKGKNKPFFFIFIFTTIYLFLILTLLKPTI